MSDTLLRLHTEQTEEYPCMGRLKSYIPWKAHDSVICFKYFGTTTSEDRTQEEFFTGSTLDTLANN